MCLPINFYCSAMSITVLLAYVVLKHVLSILLLLFQKTIMFSRTTASDGTDVYIFETDVQKLKREKVFFFPLRLHILWALARISNSSLHKLQKKIIMKHRRCYFIKVVVDDGVYQSNKRYFCSFMSSYRGT